MSTAAVIYAAKSTEDKHGSIGTQLEDCRALAEREGWTVIGEFSDEAFSAYHRNRGPGLESAKAAAIAAAAEHGSCVLVAQDADRFARGAGDAPGAADHLGEVYFAMKRQQVELWTVRSRQLDLLRAALEGERAHDETARKAQAVLAGIGRVKAKGRPWGAVPCGYRIDRAIVDDQVVAKRVIDPAGAAVCEAIWSGIEAGEGWGPLARSLNARGFRTKRGNPWTPPVTRDVAKSRLYLGENGYPPLIDRERWERIQALIDGSTPVSRQRQLGGRYATADALLKGIAFCLKCGSPMHLRSDKTGYYTCRAKRRGTGLCDAPAIPFPVADERVLSHLDTFVGSVEEWIQERVAAHSGQREVHEQALRREEAALSDAQRLRAKLMAEYERQVADDRPTAYLALEAVERKDREVEEHRRRAQAAQALLEEWEGSPDVNAAVAYYEELISAIRGRISGARSVREVNAALSTIVGGIWLGYDGQRLQARFALRPLDGREDLAEPGHKSAPKTCGPLSEPLPPTNRGRILRTRSLLAWQSVEQPTSQSRSSRC